VGKDRGIRMNRPIDEYLKHADALAQDVVNVWGSNWEGGKGYFTPEFKVLLDRTFPYWEAKRTAENHREFGTVSRKVAAAEHDTRLTFAQAYKTFWERHEELEGVH